MANAHASETHNVWWLGTPRLRVAPILVAACVVLMAAGIALLIPGKFSSSASPTVKFVTQPTPVFTPTTLAAGTLIGPLRPAPQPTLTTKAPAAPMATTVPTPTTVSTAPKPQPTDKTVATTPMTTSSNTTITTDPTATPDTTPPTDTADTTDTTDTTATTVVGDITPTSAPDAPSIPPDTTVDPGAGAIPEQ